MKEITELGHKFPGIYLAHLGRKTLLYTENLTPGITYFDEMTLRAGGKEYREFNPLRSKLAASIMNQISQMGLKKGDVVLYLGCSHGYTPSYVSDIVGPDGFVFAIDIAPRVVRDIVFMCQKRRNMTAILADANQPKTYANHVCQVDFIYQDIAQKNQAEIFLKNCDLYLKDGGFAFLAIKARSIDITQKPGTIYNEVRAMLDKAITVVDYRKIEEFQKDHCVFICKKK